MPCLMVCALLSSSLPFHCKCIRHSGYIAGFPNTYAEKVGKTSDALYKGVAPTRHETALSLDIFVVLQRASRHI